MASTSLAKANSTARSMYPRQVLRDQAEVDTVDCSMLERSLSWVCKRIDLQQGAGDLTGLP
jgi:hypothetical protein